MNIRELIQSIKNEGDSLFGNGEGDKILEKNMIDENSIGSLQEFFENIPGYNLDIKDLDSELSNEDLIYIIKSISILYPDGLN